MKLNEMFYGSKVPGCNCYVLLFILQNYIESHRITLLYIPLHSM